jgi:acyl dehydratase
LRLLTDALRARIGEERVYTAPEELSRASIRYYARAVGDDNPLYTDEGYARAHGYDGVIAPPTLICDTNQYCDLPRDRNGFAGHEWGLDVPGTRLVRGGNTYEFHRPVRPGDVVTAHWQLVDMVERRRRDGTAMLVVTSRASYSDADGNLLATNDETLIYVGSS